VLIGLCLSQLSARKFTLSLPQPQPFRGPDCYSLILHNAFLDEAWALQQARVPSGHVYFSVRRRELDAASARDMPQFHGSLPGKALLNTTRRFEACLPASSTTLYTPHGTRRTRTRPWSRVGEVRDYGD
jgi:hypothetical protein